MRFAKRTNWDLRPNELAEALAKHRASGKPLIDLTVSNPTECGFEYDTETILAALRNPAALRYEPDPKGMRSAREAVAGYYADRGDRVDPEDILLTTSTSEAYSWVFRLLCDPGDEVLIPTPSYPLFDFLADINDVNLVRYPLVYLEGGASGEHGRGALAHGATARREEGGDLAQDATSEKAGQGGWRIDFDALERAITPRTRAVMVVHPNNPTGNYCKPHEMRRLNEICAAHGLAVVADEVFLDYALDGQRRASFATNGNHDSFNGVAAPLTFTLSGLSKVCGLPQMKVAWAVVSGPEPVKSDAIARLEMISDTYLSLNAPVQLAVPALLQTRHGFQRQALERVRANVAEIDRQLTTRKELARDAAESVSRDATPIWSRLAIEGGWCAVLRARCALERGYSIAERYLARGAYVHSGSFYELSPTDVVVTLLQTPHELQAGVKLLSHL